MNEALLTAYAALSGARLRFVGEGMRRRMVEFLQHFTLEEFERVYRYVAMMVGREAKGFSRLSLQLHCLIGRYGDMDEGLQHFQERLAMADEAIKRGHWHPKVTYRGNERLVLEMPKEEPKQAQPSVDKETVNAGLAGLLGRLGT